MDYRIDMEKTKDYIERHLADELTADKIASEAGYSLFHFCRIFKETTGESLMRYVRTRRLEISAKELKRGGKVPDVALKYGFETASGFSRAYKRFYGESPCGKIA